MNVGNLIGSQSVLPLVPCNVGKQGVGRCVLLDFGKIAQPLDGFFQQFGYAGT